MDMDSYDAAPCEATQRSGPWFIQVRNVRHAFSAKPGERVKRPMRNVRHAFSSKPGERVKRPICIRSDQRGASH